MIWVGIERAPMGVYVVLARIHGMCLNLNCTFILVLMLKKCLTWVRSTWFRKILPIDDHIMFHKLVGYFIAYLSFGHIVGHIGSYSKYILTFLRLFNSVLHQMYSLARHEAKNNFDNVTGHQME